MAKREPPPPTETEYYDGFASRVREEREFLGWTQQQMADALGIPVARYRKYEKRSALPHHLIGKFSLFIGKDPAYLVTGQKWTMRPSAAQRAIVTGDARPLTKEISSSFPRKRAN